MRVLGQKIKVKAGGFPQKDVRKKEKCREKRHFSDEFKQLFLINLNFNATLLRNNLGL